MADIPKDYVLQPGQRAYPVLWAEPWPAVTLPTVTDDLLVDRFDTKNTRRLRTWGHGGPFRTHWIAVRAGTPMHIDPGFERYTHQLVVRNDGWKIHGMESLQREHPPMPRSTFVCVDTHSPHKLSRDRRLGGGLWYVALVVDDDGPLSPHDAWARLLQGYPAW